MDQFMHGALEPLGVEVGKVRTLTLGLMIQPGRPGSGPELLTQG